MNVSGVILIKDNRKKRAVIFAVALLVVAICLLASLIKTDIYNHARHHATFSGAELFSADGDKEKEVTVTAAARGST